MGIQKGDDIYENKYIVWNSPDALVDVTSRSIRLERLRLKVFIWISFLAAAAVCFVGTIGFIGLVGPHVARMFVGDDQRFFLPMSAFAGAALLSAASIGSKLIIPGAIFPIGIVTSFIGVPFFLALILLKRREFW